MDNGELPRVLKDPLCYILMVGMTYRRRTCVGPAARGHDTTACSLVSVNSRATKG